MSALRKRHGTAERLMRAHCGLAWMTHLPLADRIAQAKRRATAKRKARSPHSLIRFVA
jgi:hypothetical protein